MMYIVYIYSITLKPKKGMEYKGTTQVYKSYQTPLTRLPKKKKR